MQRIPAEDIRHILWSSLPRPPTLYQIKLAQGDLSFPRFLLDLMSKSTQSDPPLGRTKTVRKVNDPVDSRTKNHKKKSILAVLSLADSCKQKDRSLEDAFCKLLLDCKQKKDLTAGREVHRCLLENGLHQNSFLACHLIKMFAICGSLSEANHIFNSFLAPDSFMWSAIISAHAYLGYGKQAIHFFEQMLKSSVKPAVQTYLAVLKACSSISALDKGRIIHGELLIEEWDINGHVSTMLMIMYAMCGSIDDAWKIFNCFSEQDDIMHNVMMLICLEYGSNSHALNILERLHRIFCASKNVIAPILGLKACLNLKDKESGKLLHVLIIEQGFELNPYACSALMAMYVSCGHLDEACNSFLRLPKKTVVMWSFMISMFAELNDYMSAVKYFQQMQQEGIKPNDVTYLSILSACSHSGLLYEGLSHFSAMRDQHDVDPVLAHYNCMVDLLARLGHALEAEDLLHAMPFKPDAVGCIALLGHHRVLGNVSGGRTSLASSNDLDLVDLSLSLAMSEVYRDVVW